MVSRFAAPGMVGRAAVVASIVAILIASCATSNEPSSQAGRESPAVETPAPTSSGIGPGPISSVTTPVAADPGYAAGIVALGLDEATAYFMAQTLSTVDVVDAHTYEVHHDFPNGATGTATYHLFQGSGMSPDDPPEYTAEVSGDEYRYTVRYAIASSDLPEDLRQQVLDGLPAAAPTGLGPTGGAVSLLGLAPIRPARGILAADSPSTIGVVVNGVVSQGEGAVLDKLVEGAEAQGWTKTARSWDAFKAGKKVWEAVETNGLITDAMAKLKALRRCAENPTNPTTKEKYATSPQTQQRVLDDLTQIENDIRSSAMALFGSMLNDTAGSLVKAAPWLGFITGAANDYVKETLQKLVQDYLRQAEENVVPCRVSYTISGSAPSRPGGITLSGKACSLEKPFKVRTQGDIVGRLEFSPRGETGGTWAFSGSETNAGFGVEGSGGYTVSLSEDKTSGTLDLGFILTVNRPAAGNATAGGPTTLTLTEAPLCDG